MKKLLLMIIGLTLVIASCEKPIELDKYYLGEKFTISVDEPAIVVDTSTQFFNNETEEWQYPEYLVEAVEFIKDNRCNPGSCVSCFGGFVEIQCQVTSLYNNEIYKGNIDYSSCTERDLEVEGSFVKSITVDGIDFKGISILPYYELPEPPPSGNNPFEIYKVKFVGIKN